MYFTFAPPNLLIVYTFTYVRIHLPFFLFTTNTLDSAVYTYLSVHRSWGNHGPQQVGRSFLRHSVLRFLFCYARRSSHMCNSIDSQAHKGMVVGSFARRTCKFYIDILLAHVLVRTTHRNGCREIFAYHACVLEESLMQSRSSCITHFVVKKIRVYLVWLSELDSMFKI